jgi:hypothetical protein
MAKARKSPMAQNAWIPLRADSVLHREGEAGYEGYLEEYFGVGSVMFDLEHRDEAKTLGWGEIGISNAFAGGLERKYVRPSDSQNASVGIVADGLEEQNVRTAQSLEVKTLASIRLPFTNLQLALSVHAKGAKKANPAPPPELLKQAEPERITTYYWAGDWGSYRSGAVGTGLVIEQSFDGEATSEWHLHQDFVISLWLQRQGDSWLRPTEGFYEVARLKRNEAGCPVLLEVRTEHLRDYLKARGMYLLVSSYRSRRQVVADASHIGWASDYVENGEDENWWVGVNQPIHEGGVPFGSSTGFFHASRTDIDADDEVPIAGLPKDDSVISKSWSVKHQGRKLHSISGELWKTETIEPGRVSERVLGEAPLTRVDFVIDGSGERCSGDELGNDSRWLWFRPSVTALLGSYRGASLQWHTRDTGMIGISRGYSVHFGLNDLGLLNVFAKDIGQLPLWQQRVWAGANIAPNGGVSAELLASQAKAIPADTKAPEAELRPAYDALNEEFQKLARRPLFKEHHAIDDIFSRIHRFRALEPTGVLELAKDLARVSVESLDGDALSVLAAPPNNMKPGSVKHLEAALRKSLGEEEARALTKVLVGINELRQADAHLPSSEFEAAFTLVGISRQDDPVAQGRQMLESLVASLAQMAKVFSRLPRKSK